MRSAIFLISRSGSCIMNINDECDLEVNIKQRFENGHIKKQQTHVCAVTGNLKLEF